MSKRTPSQRLAVATVRAAAKEMIAEIDRYHDPRQTDFTAYFHLERWRIENATICGLPGTIRHGFPIFKSRSSRLSS